MTLTNMIYLCFRVKRSAIMDSGEKERRGYKIESTDNFKFADSS